ncbi:polysaccharide pyruvyl transferase family protein [Methylomonas sp. DH-1]|uniref:polysaccharide pyruvyl transferase family protein n=1 Tax=Methylomonas sp. (strain DH-1) TaxID=1727196 RepID=UPI0007C92177|nr:polysaccharide pyruvyl transferase family protein [Methylomonas sp. DH-1]ANE53877.1 hypothetical protein AYM39_00880 [Methylomonas sp. DH-1]
MKVGILTYHFSDNYGALFQAYALRKWFVDAGHDASFINYHPEHVEAGGEIDIRNLFSKNNAKVIYLRLSRLKNKWFGNSLQHDGFEQFRRDFLGIFGKQYKTAKELECAELEYDLLVCGSDQVWNPSEHFGVDPVYFLDFKIKNSGARRISYAPSFGRSELNPKYDDQIKQLLLKLDGISVREMSGVSIVKQLIGTEPVCVPDPTVLLSDYTDIIKPYEVSSSKHVFCYGLRSRAVIGDVAESIAKHFDAALYSPHNPHRRWREIGETVYPCPRQWLYLLAKAEFVVTNSFHGTALSILLNKPFVVVGLQGNRSGFNARALNLLELVGLNSRFIDAFSQEKVADLINDSINWEEVNGKLNDLRSCGASYLTQQLSCTSEAFNG